MKHIKHFSLLVIVLLSSCSNLAIPSPTSTSTPSPSATPSPTFTPEPIYTPDPKENLSHYGLIAYTSDIAGNEDIFTMHANGRNQTNITNNPARDMDPAWSPDGKKIAFISPRKGNAHIFVTDFDGGNTNQLTDGASSEYYFAWSPDGQKIAYVTHSHDPNISTAQLIVMNPDGSNKTVQANKLFSEYEVFGWSPDSQYLVYRIMEGEEKPGLYLVNVEGSTQIEWADLYYMDHIHWLDNKSFIAYSRFWWDPDKGQRLIQKLGTDGSQTEFPVSETTVVTVFDNTYVTRSQDGLQWFTITSTPMLLASCNKKCLGGYTDTYFSISPNKKLAFVTASYSNKSSFFLMNEDGAMIQKVGNLVYDGLQITQASWSPDSKYVAKVIEQLTGYIWSEDIYLFDIQRMLEDPSTQPIRLTTDGATKSWGPVWQSIP